MIIKKKCFGDGLMIISILGAVGMILSVILSSYAGLGIVVMLYLAAVVTDIIYNISKIKHLGGI